ncbi:MAG: hypothetical protein ACMXYE_04675 [Candidatus Woesearchaeota archaeon]
MSQESYRIERTLSIFMFISIGLVLFSVLSFFGLIPFGFVPQSNCDLPRGFSCDSIIIRPTGTELHLSYSGPAIFELTIERERCGTYRTENVFDNSEIIATFSCENGVRGDSVSHDYTFTFLRQGSSSVISGKGRIRGTIE